MAASFFKEILLLRVWFEVLILVSLWTIPPRQKVVHVLPLFRDVFHEMSAWRGLAHAFSWSWVQIYVYGFNSRRVCTLFFCVFSSQLWEKSSFCCVQTMPHLIKKKTRVFSVCRALTSSQSWWRRVMNKWEKATKASSVLSVSPNTSVVRNYKDPPPQSQPLRSQTLSVKLVSTQAC